MPTLVAAVWIEPKLRVPNLWFGVCLTIFLATVAWLGTDLFQFARGGGTAKEFPLRLLYVLLGETGKPALQLMLGTFLAAIFCWRFSEPGPTPNDSLLPNEIDTVAQSANLEAGD